MNFSTEHSPEFYLRTDEFSDLLDAEIRTIGVIDNVLQVVMK